jgi:hypothetical protein
MISGRFRMAVPVPIVPFDDYRLARFRELAGRYEIRPDFCSKLRQLEGFEIVIVCDDSGSMANILDQTQGDPFGKKYTRWDELKHYVSIVTDIAGVLDQNGLDIYFLNRPSVTGITHSDQVQPLFQNPPAGYTPIPRVFNQILRDKAAIIAEKKMLILIATDGQPTNDVGNDATNEFFQCLKARSQNVYVSIIACTDDNSSMAYLNEIDRIVPSVDVNDDYVSEKKEVQMAQGTNYAFSFGDYVVKTLLGSIDPVFDTLDEKRHESAARAYTASVVTADAVDNCCSVM